MAASRWNHIWYKGGREDLQMIKQVKKRIQENWVAVEEMLDVNIFQHLLHPHQLKAVEGVLERRLKARALYNHLQRCPDNENKEFVNLISGLYPSLFERIMGKRPTPKETGLCVAELRASLGDAIRERGHAPDTVADEKINLEDQFIQLHLVKDSLGSWDDALPHKYQKNLGPNVINYMDILSKEETMVLLRGRAGVGKTTLSQWLLCEWANIRWEEKCTCAFMLNLRHLVNDDHRMKLSDLLLNYSLYNPGGKHPQLGLWLQNCPEKTIFFLDGIDELPELESLLRNTKKIHSLDEKASSLEWCVNILRGDVLRRSTKLVFSRPFTGLGELHPDRVIELFGLTEEKVLEFAEKHVPQEKREHVKNILTNNPTILSACAITYYASALCKVLQEENLDKKLNIETYTQLTAYIVLRSATRGLTACCSPAYLAMALRGFLPLFTKLALSGLQSGNNGHPKLVFDDQDFLDLDPEITLENLEDMKKAGLLHTVVLRERFFGEFAHLSVQELLAVSELVKCGNKDLTITDTGRFNMASMFVCGLTLDRENVWVSSFLRATGHKKWDVQPQDDMKKRLKKKILKSSKKITMTLQNLQVVYESQSEDIAQSMAKQLIKSNTLEIKNTPLTAIDMNALVFVIKNSKRLHDLRLNHVSLDTSSAKALAVFLIGNGTITDLGLWNIRISDGGWRELGEALQVNSGLQTLDLRRSDISDVGCEYLGQALQVNSGIETLIVNRLYVSEGAWDELEQAQKWNPKLKITGTPSIFI